MTLKNIVAVALALIGGYFLLKVLWWALGMAFTIAITLLQIVIVAAVAVPIYLFIRYKLLR